MVIEYTGNVIRSVLTDKREKYYESRVGISVRRKYPCMERVRELSGESCGFLRVLWFSLKGNVGNIVMGECVAWLPKPLSYSDHFNKTLPCMYVSTLYIRGNSMSMHWNLEKTYANEFFMCRKSAEVRRVWTTLLHFKASKNLSSACFSKFYEKTWFYTNYTEASSCSSPHTKSIDQSSRNEWCNNSIQFIPSLNFFFWNAMYLNNIALLS